MKRASTKTDEGEQFKMQRSFVRLNFMRLVVLIVGGLPPLIAINIFFLMTKSSKHDCLHFLGRQEVKMIRHDAKIKKKKNLEVVL